MGLLISLYLSEDDDATKHDDFYIGDTQVVLEDITHSNNFKLRVVTSAMDNLIAITDKQMIQILPDVMVSAGIPTSSRPNEVKVIIEAPKKIKILRGAIYRRDYGSD